MNITSLTYSTLNTIDRWRNLIIYLVHLVLNFHCIYNATLIVSLRSGTETSFDPYRLKYARTRMHRQNCVRAGFYDPLEDMRACTFITPKPAFRIIKLLLHDAVGLI